MASSAAKMGPQEMALYAAGALVALTAIGYVHDNYWDPSRRPKRSRLPQVGKTDLELGFGGRLPPLELLNKMMKMGDELKQAKNYKEAEKYYLRLYGLVSDMPLTPEEKTEMGAIVLTHLILNYKLMRRWDLMSTAINELFTHQPDPLQRSEWMFPLVDALSHQKRYSEAVATGEQIKKSLTELPAGAPIKRMMFQAQEQMSNVFWAAGQLDKAEAEMTSALTLRGHNPARALELELNLASLYLVRGETEKAEKTIENWSNRPELNGKTEAKKKITIASCYYRANQLEVADSMFSKLLDEATGNDHEECLSYLSTIAHERDDPKRARAYYHSLRKTTTYVRTMSRYLVTTSASFREKKMESGGVRGVWNVVLQIRSLLVKSLPGLKVGNVMRISVETIEEEKKDEDKEEDKKEGDKEEDKKEEDKKEEDKKEEDKEEKSLRMVTADVPVTKAMLDEDYIEFDTPETVVPRRKKMLIELHIYNDNKKEEVLGFHYQLVRLS